MGFESFRVELRGGPASFEEADEAVRRLPAARPDHDALGTAGARYFTVEDGTHVIEVEVADAPVRVSCRFTLSHPPSVDAVFLDLLRDVQHRLGMEARVCDDIPPDQAGWYPAARFSELERVATARIATRRAEWAANFGPTLLAAKTPEVYSKIILPRCVPVAG